MTVFPQRVGYVSIVSNTIPRKRRMGFLYGQLFVQAAPVHISLRVREPEYIRKCSIKALENWNTVSDKKKILPHHLTAENSSPQLQPQEEEVNSLSHKTTYCGQGALWGPEDKKSPGQKFDIKWWVSRGPVKCHAVLSAGTIRWGFLEEVAFELLLQW